LENDTGQGHAARGWRFLQAPQFFASSFSLQKPERLMALLMVMTVCFLGYAAWEYRIRQARKTPQATCPDQKGKRVQNPTARWVFHSFGGMHLLSVSGQWPLVFKLPEEHCRLLTLLGKSYMQLYGAALST
jgi:transposase